MELTTQQRAVLTHLAAGGLIALRVYGQRTVTMEVTAQPLCIEAGLKSTDRLLEMGMIRRGDPVPYKSGRSFPFVLTDEGRATATADPEGSQQ